VACSSDALVLQLSEMVAERAFDGVLVVLFSSPASDLSRIETQKGRSNISGLGLQKEKNL
jgi:hypothetical protein